MIHFHCRFVNIADGDDQSQLDYCWCMAGRTRKITSATEGLNQTRNSTTFTDAFGRGELDDDDADAVADGDVRHYHVLT